MTIERQELITRACELGVFCAPEEHTDQELRDAIAAEEAAGAWLDKLEQLPTDAAKRDAVHRLAQQFDAIPKESCGKWPAHHARRAALRALHLLHLTPGPLIRHSVDRRHMSNTVYEPGDLVEILVGGPHENRGRSAKVNRVQEDGDVVIYFGDQDEDEWVYSPNELTKLDDLPDDLELSRDADKIVSALTVRIDCRRCGDFVSGPYRATVMSHRAHMQLVHGLT